MYIENSAPEIPSRKIIVKNSAMRTNIECNSEIRVTNIQIASPSNKENDTNSHTNILLINSQKQSQIQSKTPRSQTASINHKEAINYLLSIFLSKESEEGNESNNVKDNHNNKMCCLSRLIMKLFPNVQINRELENDLNFISYLLSLSYNSNDSIHHKILDSVKLFLIDNSTLSSSINDNTLKIFTLLQMLSMYQLYPSFMIKIYNLIQTHIVSLFEKITSICNNIYESEMMIRFYNNNNNVIDTLNDFIIGVVDIVVESISTVLPRKGIEETLKEKIEEVEERINRDSPSSIVWKAKFVKEKYKKEVNSMTMSLVDDISN